MKIDFERMELARKSPDRGIGKTFVTAWDAIEQLPECKVMVWEVPHNGWIDHVVNSCIAPICECKGLGIQVKVSNGRVKVDIFKQGERLGIIYLSHYKDTVEHFRGMRYRKVNDYGELVLYLERMTNG